jgi:hypothetical protein
MLLVQIGRVEAALADGRVENRKRAPRRLLDQHRRHNGLAGLARAVDERGEADRAAAHFLGSACPSQVGHAERKLAVELGHRMRMASLP